METLLGTRFLVGIAVKGFFFSTNPCQSVQVPEVAVSTYRCWQPLACNPWVANTSYLKLIKLSAHSCASSSLTYFSFHNKAASETSSKSQQPKSEKSKFTKRPAATQKFHKTSPQQHPPIDLSRKLTLILVDAA